MRTKVTTHRNLTLSVDERGRWSAAEANGSIVIEDQPSMEALKEKINEAYRPGKPVDVMFQTYGDEIRTGKITSLGVEQSHYGSKELRPRISYKNGKEKGHILRAWENVYELSPAATAIVEKFNELTSKIEALQKERRALGDRLREVGHLTRKRYDELTGGDRAA